jgi:hypothetical protein
LKNETNEPFTQKLIIDTVGLKKFSPEIPIEEFYEMEPDSEQFVLFEVVNWEDFSI